MLKRKEHESQMLKFHVKFILYMSENEINYVMTYRILLEYVVYAIYVAFCMFILFARLRLTMTGYKSNICHKSFH